MARGHINRAVEAALIELMNGGARSRLAIRILMEQRFPSLSETIISQHLTGLVEAGKIIRKGAQRNMTFELA